ncbi:MAG: PmoA family protein [Bacteroidota bacterium]|nr:PmoA family protein [Bacteroidota bacterium]
MKTIRNLVSVALLAFIWVSCSSNKKEDSAKSFVKVIQIEEEQRVDILIDDVLFTSYLYTDTIPDLKKTCLFPIYSAKGSIVTRGYPLDPRPGERIDHPHHIGMWLNYGDVNKIDFWGNSNAIPEDQRDRMGTIRHKKVEQAKSGEGSGSLDVEMEWVNSDKHTLLKENTSFVFQAGDDYRIIDRITTLTAQKDKILFEDTKEGMMAIRLNRALELPSDKPVVLSDVHGNKTEVAKLDNTGVTGKYLNSEGVKGLDVWGKRAKWVSLSGKIGEEDVSVIIFDHPENPNHPAYWHARGYGLFAINPLGQKTFTNGEQELNLSLDPAQSVTFKYRVFIKSGLITASEINDVYDSYIKKY